MRKRITVGILAHVDAGKTTCIESMLYQAKAIRHFGRVDHKDTLLDFDQQERDRGITIFSKEASFAWNDAEIFVIDTPGHMDFSSEMERSLQVLDLAILLINGQDGVQSHTKTIWKCLEQYHVPTLIFINKMDISFQSEAELLEDLQKKCSPNCLDMKEPDILDQWALINEEILNAYIETGDIPLDLRQEAVFRREAFPCFFGSALKQEGITKLMDAIVDYSLSKEYPKEFGAKVYKISSDENGNRLTHVKITGGSLVTKQKITETEKVDQIRIYKGQSFQAVQAVEAGTICVLKGPQSFEVGQGLGIEADSKPPLLHAYMRYELILPKGVNPLEMKQVCDQLAQEDPSLYIQYNEATKTISLRLMGSIQMEILSKLIYQRSGIQVGFSSGKVVYKETITEPVIGVGHFEPLRHYAEVHVKLEPLPRNSGMQFESNLSSNELAINWQRLILTHLEEKEHKGVLTRSPITDIKISVVAGKAHLKHTMGGDFRQATYRAVRQGLRKAQSILLEPYYQFTLSVPNASLSRALYDLETKHATVKIEASQNDTTLIQGRGPVALLNNYQQEVIAYTKGLGKFHCQLDGYDLCHNAEEIIAQRQYDPDNDRFNPTGSVFCTHGSGYYVPWDQVEDYMHIQPKQASDTSYRSVKYTISDEEAKRAFENQSGKNRNPKKQVKPKKKKVDTSKTHSVQPTKPVCILIDGYNQIFGWDIFRTLDKQDFSSARDQLIDWISNYQGYRGCRVILVFDAYRVKDSETRNYKRGGVEIVYTKYNQTADSYIETLVPHLKADYQLVVASSDGLIQNSILAQGCQRMSARELENAVLSVNESALKLYKEKQLSGF